MNVHYGPGQGVFGQSKPYLSAISRSTNPVPTKYSGTATNGAHRSTRSPSPTKTSIPGTSPSKVMPYLLAYKDLICFRQNSNISRIHQ